MKGLARAQAESGLYAAVGIGVVTDRRWPSVCREELRSLGLPFFSAETVPVFGTAQFLWQRLAPPPVDSWVERLQSSSKASRCIVHFHNAWMSGVFLPLASARRGQSRVVATIHGVNAHFRGQPVRQRLHQWMARRLVAHRARLTSVDRSNLSRARDLLGLDPAAVSVIPNGISDTPARGCPRARTQGAFTVGHVGSIAPQKGWEMLVDAARRVREKGVDVKVVLAGRGADESRARELAERNPGWLTYEGFVSHARETIMTRLDALALMSEQEGLPMAIIEALSVGVPVAATPVGGVPEAVTDRGNGFLVERSAAALAEAIGRLAQDENLLRNMSAAARRCFEERFEISRILSLYDKLYRQET